MTATRLSVWTLGIWGSIHRFSQAFSMIEYSIVLIATGASWRLSVHASSQGAGHTRPVNSGKLFVRWSTSMASRQLPRNTRSFQSGMVLSTGQPEWQ